MCKTARSIIHRMLRCPLSLLNMPMLSRDVHAQRKIGTDASQGHTTANKVAK